MTTNFYFLRCQFYFFFIQNKTKFQSIVRFFFKLIIHSSTLSNITQRRNLRFYDQFYLLFSYSILSCLVLNIRPYYSEGMVGEIVDWKKVIKVFILHNLLLKTFNLFCIFSKIYARNSPAAILCRIEHKKPFIQIHKFFIKIYSNVPNDLELRLSVQNLD